MSFATKMVDEENLVVVDEQPESQKGKKKGPRRSKFGRIRKLKPALNRSPVQQHLKFLRTTLDSFSSSP